MDKIRVIELFAGVGGFRLGLEKASKSFNIVWSNIKLSQKPWFILKMFIHRVFNIDSITLFLLQMTFC